MRVKDFILMYSGMNRVEVEIYASVTIFNEEYHVLVREFVMDYAKVYSERKENFMSEEVLGFEIESGKLKLFIRGCE